ncbi:tetratricopeptide repeat protein [Roseomonas indoligenes]|uniref:Sel1 repeat family protein n=1 Tax=Roseomonas indoligenes TaxID=2820811 RepID=A0A940MXR8_9PROT|nr:tetratricopeptide repeat protein [Pararoseomonas indoligenes]MBP0492421.1 sel1 repeat family protein [Pararoseomonas indoligenes]
MPASSRGAPARRRSITFTELTAASPESLAAAFAAPPEEAAPWVEAAARYGIAGAQTRWGQMLLEGLGVPKDERAALAWFKAAAGAGDAEGMTMLGRCHELGWGTPVDYAAAVYHFRRSAELGFDWGQYNLANMLMRGDGVARDRDAALRWYRAAAAQGHAKSINVVARAMEEGWDAPPDPAGAVRLYRLSAERGDFRGQFNLGTLLTDEGQIAEAVHWFRASARLANATFRRSMLTRLAERQEPEIRAVLAEVEAMLAAA